MNLRILQAEVNEWARRNFGPHEPPYHRALLGAVEEVGELAHAHLKGEQGIRGTAEEHVAAGQDAVADTIIYLADYCNARGWDLAYIVTRVWGQVAARDWKRDPINGSSKETENAHSSR